jgi:hypothetical protein
VWVSGSCLGFNFDIFVYSHLKLERERSATKLSRIPLRVVIRHILRLNGLTLVYFHVSGQCN